MLIFCAVLMLGPFPLYYAVRNRGKALRFALLLPDFVICFNTLVVGSRVGQGWVAILAALFFLVPIVLDLIAIPTGFYGLRFFDRIHRGIAAFAMTIYYLVLGIISAVTYFSNNLPPTDPAFVVLLGNSIAFLGFLFYDIARLSTRGVTPDDDDD